MKMRIKRTVAFLLCAVMLLGLIPMGVAAASKTEITLWTFPVGAWGDSSSLNELIGKFEAANPGVSVKVEYLDYMNGDAKVNAAIAAGAAPDLILAEPERIVVNWGMQGAMVDLSGMLDSTDRKEIYPNILNACVDSNNSMYMYPLSGVVHTMAINKTVFAAAGAMKYINEETHTWKSTDDFFKALKAVADYTGKEIVGTVYCGGQGGDQGTRALVTNLYGGTFTNASHTAYTWDSAENIKALTALYNCENLKIDPTFVGGDEITQFANGVLNVAFCWNIAQQLNRVDVYTGTSKNVNGDEIMFMGFPSDDAPLLQGGIWGFGIFDNGNSAKIDAAKTFIKYMCDSKATVDAVKLTNYFPVRTSAEGTDLSTTWESDSIMSEFSKMMKYIGDYYQVTSSWSIARTAWWNMLQEVGYGDKGIAEIVKTYTAEVNATMPEQDVEHDWSAATCTEPKTCKICGATEGVALGHDWKDATCTAPKTCKVCGATEGDPVPHIFDQEKVEPKYLVSEGVYYKSCKCGEAGTETFTVKEEKPEEKPVEFKDVPQNAYYHSPVMWAVENKVTSGTGDGTTFEPNAVCTRGQVVTFLWRAAGQPEPKNTDNPFKDVKTSDYFYKAVLWALENKITTGTGDGTTFEPHANCNRGQIVTFLSRAKGGKATTDVNPFKDVASNAYYYNPVLWAVENGITTGTGDGTTFKPNEDCTRGQVITFLYRAYTK